jgi:hypothetical protein
LKGSGIQTTNEPANSLDAKQRTIESIKPDKYGFFSFNRWMHMMRRWIRGLGEVESLKSKGAIEVFIKP